MITISHTIIATDSKGYAKQQMTLTHKEYLELSKQLANEIVIQEEKNEYEFLKNILFGGIHEDGKRN